MAISIFTDIFSHVDNIISTYAASKVAAVATTIEPAVITGMSTYLLFYGYRHLKGEIEQPVMAFIDSLVKIVTIVTVSLKTGQYAQPIIDTFQGSPIALASAISGSAAPNLPAQLDATLGKAWDISVMFFDQGGITQLDAYIYGLLVLFFGGAVTIYTAVLVLMSKILTGVLLALTSLFVVSLMFEKTQGFFGNFFNTLINQGLVLVLAVATNEFILSLFQHSVEDMAALGAAAKAVNVLVITVTGALGLLVLGQVTGIASSLAGGVSLSTFGIGRAGAKLAGKGLSRATGGQGRENQRAAKNQLDVQGRKDKLVARKEANKRKSGLIKQNKTETRAQGRQKRDGTNG